MSMETSPDLLDSSCIKTELSEEDASVKQSGALQKHNGDRGGEKEDAEVSVVSL